MEVAWTHDLIVSVALGVATGWCAVVEGIDENGVTKALILAEKKMMPVVVALTPMMEVLSATWLHVALDRYSHQDWQ
jgi:F0F1-type ATP synthase membrane subunit a